MENAFNISYEKRFNEVWSASFSLPLDDIKNEFCKPFFFVEIFEDDEMTERIDLFRIMPKRARKNEGAKTITYECEHVLATLMDDILFQYHQTTGLPTDETLEYILEKQTKKHWQLGRVDFTLFFHYKWENETLLRALFSVPRPFDRHYQWKWDTTSYPWTLNLVEPPSTADVEIRYRKNMREIERTVDPNDIVTRLYPLGYGEGVNQLTIRSVNPTGQPYIEKNVDKYGVVARAWVDRRFEDPESLFATAQAMLDELSRPFVSYRVSAVDLSKLADYPVERFDVGQIVKVIDEDFGEFEARIVSVRKRDVKGDPGNVEIEIANKKKNIAGSIADLNDRQRINEVYAQGATNVLTFNYHDNCDANIPAVIPIYIDDDVVHVNTCELTFRTKPFRAYSRTTEGGGGIVTTTASGGGTTVTSASGGGTSVTSSSGGGTTETTTNNGAHEHRLMAYDGSAPTTGYTTRYYHIWLGQQHGGSAWVKLETTAPAGTHPYTYDLIGQHTHSVTVPNHTHSVTIPNHTHQITIPDHTHEIQIPDHTHDVKHEIVELDTLPTSVEIKVDGNRVPHTAIQGDRIDIVDYLEKDSNGKVKRGRHEITIHPDGLARIEADVILRVFIQSRLGGNY